MAWTRNLLREHVYRVLGRAPGEAVNDDQAPVALVNLALDEAYRQFAYETQGFTRAHTLIVAGGQTSYALPADVCYLPPDGVTYGSDPTPLPATSETELSDADAGWRADTGTPDAWYLTANRELGLYPAPAGGAVAVTLRGHIIPYLIGGGVAAIARQDNTVTVTTAHPHELTAGDRVTVRGVAPGDFDGSVAVDAVPGATTFTYIQPGDDAAGSGGIVYYAGGLPTFTADTDIPTGIPMPYQLALAYYAAAWIAGECFLDDRATAERAALALVKYRALVTAFNSERLAMMI